MMMMMKLMIVLLLCLGLVVATQGNNNDDDDEIYELPNHQGKLQERVFGGYAIANTSSDAHLYYLMFESRRDQNDPVIIWLNGGPGASSALGCFLENGPYQLQGNLSLLDNAYAWNTFSHLVYFDQPVGTGFSYADDYVDSLDQLSAQFYSALTDFFTRLHPELIDNPLFITGESFAGVYIPKIAAYIDSQNQKSDSLHLNMKGVLIGNPGNLHPSQYYSQIDYALNVGLIGEQQAERALELWKECEATMDIDPVRAFNACEKMSNYIVEKAGNPFVYDIRQWGDVYDDVYAKAMGEYLSMDNVKEALNVGNHTWQNGDGTSAPNPVVNHLQDQLMIDVLKELEQLLENGYGVTIYDGVFDASSCNHRGAYRSVSMLEWTDKESFSSAERMLWKSDSSQYPFGYDQVGGGLRFVWVSNSGHLVPTAQPEAALHLLKESLSFHSFK